MTLKNNSSSFRSQQGQNDYNFVFLKIQTNNHENINLNLLVPLEQKKILKESLTVFFYIGGYISESAILTYMSYGIAKAYLK